MDNVYAELWDILCESRPGDNLPFCVDSEFAYEEYVRSLTKGVRHVYHATVGDVLTHAPEHGGTLRQGVIALESRVRDEIRDVTQEAVSAWVSVLGRCGEHDARRSAAAIVSWSKHPHAWLKYKNKPHGYPAGATECFQKQIAHALWRDTNRRICFDHPLATPIIEEEISYEYRCN